jgi:cleavage and polyadenylation specificity factor subunit 3
MEVQSLRQQLNQTIQTHQIQTSSGDFLEITPLGAGNEVGRSCIYIECKGCKVLMDCGIHPGKEGI